VRRGYWQLTEIYRQASKKTDRQIVCVRRLEYTRRLRILLCMHSTASLSLLPARHKDQPRYSSPASESLVVHIRAPLPQRHYSLILRAQVATPGTTWRRQSWLWTILDVRRSRATTQVIIFSADAFLRPIPFVSFFGGFGGLELAGEKVLVDDLLAWSWLKDLHRAGRRTSSDYPPWPLALPAQCPANLSSTCNWRPSQA
jgi:hypothetical protein